MAMLMCVLSLKVHPFTSTKEVTTGISPEDLKCAISTSLQYLTRISKASSSINQSVVMSSRVTDAKSGHVGLSTVN